jgi:hypothetical protein
MAACLACVGGIESKARRRAPYYEYYELVQMRRSNLQGIFVSNDDLKIDCHESGVYFWVMDC